MLSADVVTAESTSLETNGTVKVPGNDSSIIVDPEKPEKPVNPGEVPSTKGDLRIDYVSSVEFGRVKIDAKKRSYKALAHQFLDDTEPRGSYIQITDQRTVSTGWSIQVKQNSQFTSDTEATPSELKGAVLSLDQAWANSLGNSPAPTVTRNTIAIQNFDTAYELATAKPNTGRGVWTIAFGASATNNNNQKNTLEPLIDDKGQAVMDSRVNKQAHSNSAIKLDIPEKVTIKPQKYKTKLTWILGDMP